MARFSKAGVLDIYGTLLTTGILGHYGTLSNKGFLCESDTLDTYGTLSLFTARFSLGVSSRILTRLLF